MVADEVYAAELDRARERSGLDEAVITGEGMIRGRRVALIACEFAFLQMVKISAAVAAHKAAGLPYLVYLRNPTTGGVLASWGSLGHVTVAEPGALVGFLGPRVYEAPALAGTTGPASGVCCGTPPPTSCLSVAPARARPTRV